MDMDHLKFFLVAFSLMMSIYSKAENKTFIR